MFNHTRSICWGIWILIALSIVMVAKVKTAHAANTIKIGIVESLTGPLGPFGQESINGANWAAEKINREGGILNRKIEFVFRDSQSRVVELVKAVKAFKHRDKAIAVIAPFGSTLSSKVISDTAERVQLPAFISSPFSDDILNKNLSFTFRIVPGQKLAAQQMFEYLMKTSSNANVHLRTCTITRIQLPGFKHLADEIKFNARKRGLEIRWGSSYPYRSKQDMAPLAAKIKEVRPDVIFQLGAPADSTDLLHWLRRLGVRPQAVVGGFNIGFSNPTWVAQKENASVIRSMNVDFWWNPKLPNIKKLQKQYYDRFGRKLSNNALHTYIVVHILRDVANKIRSVDHVKLANGIHSQTFESPLAQFKPIKFGADGSNKNAQTVLLQVSNPVPKVRYPDPFAEEDAIFPWE